MELQENREIILENNKPWPKRPGFNNKWYHLDLNQGHTDFQSVALPTELWYQKEQFFTL